MTDLIKTANNYRAVNTLGDTFYLYFPTVTENDISVDWTGWTAKMQIKNKSTDITALVDVTQLTGIDLSVNGRLTITISAATMTAALGVGNYVWDVQMTRSDGRVETWFQNAELEITQDVTR